MMTTGIGREWPSEMKVTTDPVSGATVRQLTDYRGHSNHSYFTYRCWYDGGRKVVIVSDRENRPNLFGVDIAGGEMTQLTDCAPAKGLGRHALIKNPTREEIYFSYDGALRALDLKTCEMRKLFRWPDGYRGGSSDVTADGRYLIAGVTEDLSDRMTLDLGHGYVGFAEMWAAAPYSMVYRINVDGSGDQLIHEDRCWLGHFNASPGLANIMTFCHEGPWNRVDNRIWGLDIETGRSWEIRPTGAGETVGHEYWMSDGEHIGYHGHVQGKGIYGSIRYDDTDRKEFPFEGHCWHFHSHMLDLVVGDGNAKEPYLFAWRLREGSFEGPKVLAWHRGSFHIQAVYVHPAVHDEGRKVLYTADPQGYGQVYLVEVPDFDSLPDWEQVQDGKK